MKINYFFILLISVLGVFANTVKAQSYLEVQDCRDIVVYYENNFSQGETSEELSYVLERELIKGVWEKIMVVSSFENVKTFTDLPIGIYRVSVVPLNKKRKSLTKIHKRKIKLQKADQEKYDVFISNSVEVRGAKNCDEQFVDLNSGSILSHLIKVFPNPVNRTLNIYYPEKKGHVAIFNVLQQKVKSQQLEKRTITQLDLDGLKAGIYIVCIYANGEVIHSEKVSYLGR